MHYKNDKKLIFFCSVYLTPLGLGKFSYNLGKITELEDRFFRVSRFLTMLYSFRNIPWDEVEIYLETDLELQEVNKKIKVSILEIFPDAVIHNFRLDSRLKWENASEKYDDNDVIFLQANDDHALISNTVSEFLDVANKINNEFPLGQVTHFPEILGTLHREKLKNFGRNLNRERYVDAVGAIGTILVNAGFFKSWWQEGKIPDHEKIVRPDNPFGKSVVFFKAKMLVPTSELVRHLDGYSHVNLNYPVSPLRNLLVFNQEITPYFLISSESWISSMWPTQLFPYARENSNKILNTSDLVKVSYKSDEPRGILSDLRIGVARIQTAWSWRIFPTDVFNILANPHPIKKAIYFPSIFIAFFSKSVIKNVIDIIDPFIILFLYPLKSNEKVRNFMNHIYCNGSRRTIKEFFLKRKFH